MLKSSISKAKGQAQSLGPGASMLRDGAKGVFKMLTKEGSLGGKVMCSVRTCYTWGVFMGIISMAWVRAMLVLNATLRIHMEALGPYRDTKAQSSKISKSSAAAAKYVLFKRRASRFVIFAILFTTVMACFLFVAILLVLFYSILQLVDMLADNMPLQLFFVTDVIHWFTGVRTFFGAFRPEHFVVHGIVLTAILGLAFFFAFAYLQEEDMKHANILRDKLMRATVVLPSVAIMLYAIYICLLVMDCF